jgi:glucan phosphorylase
MLVAVRCPESDSNRQALQLRIRVPLLLPFHHSGPGGDFTPGAERWTRKSIPVARIGGFCSDRAIRQYCEDIWKLHPLVAPPPT